MKFSEFVKQLNEEEKKASSYEEFFKKKLEKYGVESPSELSKEDKIKFFSEIEDEWVSEDEAKEDLKESKITWEDCEVATKTIQKNLFKADGKITGDNSLNIRVQTKNGYVVGKVTFDPSFKF